jgi:hypothetical protein
VIEKPPNRDKEEEYLKFKEILSEDEVLPFENKYYMDGVIPPIKAISSLTKSIQNLNAAGGRNDQDDTEE